MSLTVADSSTPSDSAQPDPIVPEPKRRVVTKRRAVAMLIYAALLALLIGVNGLPTDPISIFLCLWVGVIAWNSDRPWRSHFGFVRDWVAVVLLLVVYNYSRGYADNGVTPHVTELIHADEWMFGWATGGEIPTLWLQHHLYNPEHAQWYDVVASFVYFSHFLAALIVAAVLWVRNRANFGAFTRRWFTLCALGLVTYFAYPAAPPWWAAQYQYISPVMHGIAVRGWYALGMHHSGNMLNAAKLDAANQIAAMPSLHSAFALLIVVFFMQRVRKRWWPLLLCYPLAMTFTLVYAGEHYVIDVLVGWAYVGVAYLLVGIAEGVWRRHKARGVSAEATDSEVAEPDAARAAGAGAATASGTDAAGGVEAAGGTDAAGRTASVSVAER
jgi:membrane-associated phospholipid phosphatase